MEIIGMLKQVMKGDENEKKISTQFYFNDWPQTN